MTYLRRTGDTLFNLKNAGRQPGPRPTNEILHQLETGSRSARVAALWELSDSSHASEAAESVALCLHDRVPAIREHAAWAIAAFGPAGKTAMFSLVDMLADSSSSIRTAATRALGALESEEVLEHLAKMLRDPDREVVAVAANGIEKFGESGTDAIPFVLGALRTAMIRCDHELIDLLTSTLYALDPDPTDRVMQFFGDDPELREQVVHIIVDTLGDDSGKFA
jgi:hypothetical protein